MCLDTERFPPLRRQRESAQLWKQQSTELESIFPDVLLVWKELSCPSVYLNQMWCDPVSGLTAPPRGSSQTCRNIWPPRPPEAASSPPSFSSSSTPLLSLFFFFLFPLITNTCGLFPPAAAKPRVSAAFPSELSTLARWDSSEP